MLDTWSEIELLTGLIIGEAADQPWAGKVGVGLTVQTRVDHPGHWHWGRNWREVILASRQFSCFENQKNLARIRRVRKKQTDSWKECAIIAEAIYHRRIDNHIGTPTHYHRYDCDPTWDDDPNIMKYLGKIGDHLFYNCL